ncbi:hypothetical protein GC207_03850 [bacterium]|nr:hypothetical protein [bacterium]
MSAAEIIKQIEELDPDQKQEVFSHVMLAVVATLRGSEARKLFETNLGQELFRRSNARKEKSETGSEVSDEFKSIAAEVFSQNEELFRKLAQ